MIELRTYRDGGQSAEDVARQVAEFMASAERSLELALYDIRLQDEPAELVTAALLARGTVGIEAIVSGGDDYEVLSTIPENRLDAFIQAAAVAGVAVSCIGTVTAGASVPRFLDAQGGEIALKRLSYSHF